ncbi:MAG: hypothetical protein K0Q49_1762 [Haloplasmataceae bacterium]|jgi:hypothetical protein|nr:hypothetical protein [Haloplasmataceae bacterium]
MIALKISLYLILYRNCYNKVWIATKQTYTNRINWIQKTLHEQKYILFIPCTKNINILLLSSDYGVTFNWLVYKRNMANHILGSKIIN